CLERVTIALRTRPARAIDPRPRPKGRRAAARRAAGTPPGAKPRHSGGPRRLVHPEGVPEGLLRPFRPPEIGGRPRPPGFTRGWAPAAFQAAEDRRSSCAQSIREAL